MNRIESSSLCVRVLQSCFFFVWRRAATTVHVSRKPPPNLPQPHRRHRGRRQQPSERCRITRCVDLIGWVICPAGWGGGFEYQNLALLVHAFSLIVETLTTHCAAALRAWQCIYYLFGTNQNRSVAQWFPLHRIDCASTCILLRRIFSALCLYCFL